MKKLMVAVAAVSMAAVVNAATVGTWSSETFFESIGKDVATGSGYEGLAWAFMFDEGNADAMTDFAALTTAKAIYSAFDQATDSLTINGHSYTAIDAAVATSDGYYDFGNLNGQEFNDTGKAYIATILLHDDGTGVYDAYAANAMVGDVIKDVGVDGSDRVAMYWGANAGGDAAVWTATATATPEPTSGLLLLLGVAGLALRRRRA